MNQYLSMTLEQTITNWHSKIKKIIMEVLIMRKATGYNLIAGKILKELSGKSHTFLTQLYNAVLRTSFFLLQWKVAQYNVTKTRKKLYLIYQFAPNYN